METYFFDRLNSIHRIIKILMMWWCLYVCMPTGGFNFFYGKEIKIKKPGMINLCLNLNNKVYINEYFSLKYPKF